MDSDCDFLATAAAKLLLPNVVEKLNVHANVLQLLTTAVVVACCLLLHGKDQHVLYNVQCLEKYAPKKRIDCAMCNAW